MPPSSVIDTLTRPVRQRWARLSDASLSDPDGIRAQRLAIFLYLGLPVTGFYAVFDICHGSIGSALSHGLAFVGMSIALARLRQGALDQACQIQIVSMCLVLGSAHLWDGQLHSMGLWLVPLLPMVAAYLLGEAAAKRYSLVALAIIAFNLVSSQLWVFPMRFPDSALQWTTLRIIALGVFSCFAMLTSSAATRVQRLLSEQNAELRREEHAATISERSKSAFLATMSDELRMPARGILDLLRMIRDRSLPRELEPVFDRMERSAARVHDLINAILDLATLESGKMRVREQVLSIHDILEDLHCRFASEAQEKGIELRTVFLCPPLRCSADGIRLRQILAALVHNAIKFSDTGTIEVILDAGPRSDEDDPTLHHYNVQIRDEGIGMTKTQLTRAFGRFEQLHESQESDRGGCGLGLALARRLAQLLGGRLDVESQPGQGSKFTLHIALQAAFEGGLDLSFSRALATSGPSVVTRTAPVATGSPEAPALPSETQDPPNALRPFITVSTPLIITFAAVALYSDSPNIAALHAGTLCGYALLLLPGRLKRVRGAGVALWMLTTFASTVGQSMFDGGFRSEALWSISMFPIVAAHFFGTSITTMAILSALLTVLAIGFAPTPAMSPFVFEDSVVSMALQRTTSLFAFAGMSIAVTRATQAELAQAREMRMNIGLANARAQQSNLAKTRFLDNMNRELSAPITVLRDSAQGLANEASLASTQQQALHAIHRCSQHMSAMLHELLQYVGAQPEQRPAYQQRFDLCTLLKDAQLMFEARASGDGLRWQAQGLNAPCWVRADPTRTLQRVSNLLDRAIRHNLEGTIILGLREDTETDSHPTRVERTFVVYIEGEPGNHGAHAELKGRRLSQQSRSRGPSDALPGHSPNLAPKGTRSSPRATSHKEAVSVAGDHTQEQRVAFTLQLRLEADACAEQHHVGADVA